MDGQTGAGLDPQVTTGSGASGGAAPGPARRGRWTSWVGVWALGLGCFSLVSAELSPVGLLPQIARGLGRSEGSVGLLVSGFALVVALTAAPLTASTSRVSRRALMVTLLLAATGGNVLAAVASDYWVLLLARILVALAIGVFWSTASSTAVSLVAPQDGVRATSIVIGGLALAQVAGVPSATWFGGRVGWHAAFAALAGLSLLAAAVTGAVLPSSSSGTAGNAGDLLRSLRSAPIRAAAAVTGLVMTGSFLLFTYIAPFLTQVTGLSTGAISLLLVVYGAAGAVGTFAVAGLITRSLRRTLFGAVLLLAVSMLLLWAAGPVPWLTVLLLIPWGAAYGALPVLLQTWVFQETRASGQRPEAASSLYVAAYNAAIGVGALAGAAVVDSTGARTLALAGALIAAVGLLRAVKPARDSVMAARG